MQKLSAWEVRQGSRQVPPGAVIADGGLTIATPWSDTIIKYTDAGIETQRHTLPAPPAGYEEVNGAVYSLLGNLAADLFRRRIVDYVTGATIWGGLPFRPKRMGLDGATILVVGDDDVLYSAASEGQPFSPTEAGVNYSSEGFTSYKAGGINGQHTELEITSFVVHGSVVYCVSANTHEIVALDAGDLSILERIPAGLAPTCIAAEGDKLYVGEAIYMTLTTYDATITPSAGTIIVEVPVGTDVEIRHGKGKGKK